jgi:cell wall-associated NlpC family hydrolase
MAVVVMGLAAALLPVSWAPAGAQEDSTTTQPSTPDTSTTTTTVPESTTTTTSPSTTVPTSSTVPDTTVPESTTTLVPTTAPLPPTIDDPTAPRSWSLAPRFDAPVDDSIEGVQRLLGQVVAELDALQARRGVLTSRIQDAARQVDDLRTRITQLTEKRKARAVTAFINGDAMIGPKIQVDDERVRIITSIEGLESTDAERRRSMERRIQTVETQAVRDQAELTASDAELAELTAARQLLQDKLTSALDTTLEVPVGPTDIALTAAAASAKRRSAAALAAAGDGAAALAAADGAQRELERLAALIARPTPGAYNADGSPKSIGPTPVGDPTLVAQQLLAAWSTLEDRRMTVMLFALQQVGKRYVWAASGPSSYDCSGLLMRAWYLGGVKLTHFSGSQIASGPSVPAEQLAPTDLLGYGPSSSEHITMYVGAGRVVEAKGSAYGVIVNNARYSDLAGTSRIL